ncbi:MAG: 3'-5' exonuclease [Candidatus Marsarchaeota archaeon]|nr:3'-5' exonuclease [Candidatus Marsarchaeota archaeon]MCL5112625.1 3'-5' exonuclease [Candidatus Marsarchaeota archaeon]
MMVVDIETSGINPDTNSILSIGAVDFGKPKNTFYGECRIRRGAHCDKEALKINGFSESEIKDKRKVTEKELVERFAKWKESVEDATIAGHNVHFDLAFLKSAARRYGTDLNIGNRIVDMHTLAYSDMLSNGIAIPLKDNRTAITSDIVYAYVGLKSEPKPHNALTGAKMEAEAICRLMFQKGMLDEFAGYGLPKRHSKTR